MIKAILFDWAGVIAADGYWIWLDENIEDLESKKTCIYAVFRTSRQRRNKRKRI